uniref:Ig-like domain-containing protein n=1 Tax=Lepisosteus oculatus TaxID=7918 RepID=W5LW29_LEPOC
MTFITIFIWTLLVSARESRGQVTVTQTPAMESVLPGQTVTVNCKNSTIQYNRFLAWYQKKVGETQKFQIYAATICQTGIQERFSGIGSGTDFTLTITGVQAEDDADYYCLAQSTSGLYTQCYTPDKNL